MQVFFVCFACCGFAKCGISFFKYLLLLLYLNKIGKNYLKMRCAVAKCKSNSMAKNFDKEVMFFRFPKDSNLQKVWINLCNKPENKPNTKHARVCSKHFSEDSYAKDWKGELLGHSAKNRRLLKADAVPSLDLPYNPPLKPELTSIKIEPILEIKSEPDCDNHYNEQSHDDTELKPEINYLIELKCKKNSGANCECITCICQPEGTDYVSENKVKLEENDHQDLLLNDDASAVSHSDWNDDKQKINASEAIIEFVNVSSIKIEKECEANVRDAVLDPLTGQMVQLKELKIPLINHKYDVKLLNSDKVFGENSEAAKSTSSKSHFCPSCQKSFITRRSFFSHILVKHSDDRNLKKLITWKIHSCFKCNKPFIVKCHLDSHMLNRHNDEPNLLEFITSKILNCPKCTKRFISKLDLDSHIKTYHNKDESSLKIISSKNYNCPKCNRQFLRRLNLDSHILSHHSDDNDLLKTISRKTLDCPKCKKQFVMKLLLQGHIRSVHADDESLSEKFSSGKVYICPKCKKQFRNKCHLDSHILSHHKDDAKSLKMVTSKKHMCPKCDQQFVYKSSLDCHILDSHKDEKDLMKSISSKTFNCPKCDRQFLLKSRFDYHVFTSHSTDHELQKMVSSKTYDCPRCNNKRYFYKTLLFEHILRIHYADHDLMKMITTKTYDCPSCCQQFITKYRVDQHILKVHK